MPLIAGLGNPGTKYAGTRHNIGFVLIDRLVNELSINLKAGKGSYYIGKGRYRDEQILLMKPTTYMNRSGTAIQEALSWYKMDIDQCLVCYDDLNLPLGTIRLRPGGSAGGHNGVKDIIRMLGTDRFPRLRIGIGGDFPEERQVEYVLSTFRKNEQKIIEKAIDRSAEAVLTFVTDGIDTAMNKFN